MDPNGNQRYSAAAANLGAITTLQEALATTSAYGAWPKLATPVRLDV